MNQGVELFCRKRCSASAADRAQTLAQGQLALQHFRIRNPRPEVTDWMGGLGENVNLGAQDTSRVVVCAEPRRALNPKP